jgi:DNA-binding transcriptional ArsR family regulator
MVADLLERADADRLFHALADGTRRDIVRRTLVHEQSVTALAAHYPMSFAAVQKHVAVLASAGLVSKHRSGREQLVRGEVEALHRAGQLLDDLELFWRARMQRLEDALTDLTPTDPDEGADR